MSYIVGELDDLISFYSEVETPNGMGGFTIVTALTASDVWASVRPASSKEVQGFDSVYASELTAFIIRSRDDITEKHRILYNGVYYNIRNVPAVSRRDEYMRIFAERGVAL